MRHLETFDPAAYPSDSAMLSAAVAAAKAADGILTIPPVNPRTGAREYLIDEAILLPSDFTVILDHCTLKLTPHATCNIFRNENMYRDGYLERLPEQKNIRILGRGDATLDGDGHNDIFEWTPAGEGTPSIYCNNLVLFHNVDGFEVSGITVKNQRWWGLNFLFCSHGRISDIRVKTGGLFSNQDGINLRLGCHHITIERVSGNSGDDLIALSAIFYRYMVKGKSTDIHDVTIRDIVASSMHESMIALRANDGHEIYNIDIENVIESNFDDENILPYGTILLGQRCFFAKYAGEHGSMHHIKIKNIRTKSGGAAVTLCNTLVDSTIEDVSAENTMNALTTVNYDHYGNTRLVVRGNADDDNFGPAGISMERVVIRNVTAADSVRGAAVDLSEMQDTDFLKDVTFENIRGAHGTLVIADRISKEGVTVK